MTTNDCATYTNFAQEDPDTIVAGELESNFNSKLINDFEKAKEEFDVRRDDELYYILKL